MVSVGRPPAPRRARPKDPRRGRNTLDTVSHVQPRLKAIPDRAMAARLRHDFLQFVVPAPPASGERSRRTHACVSERGHQSRVSCPGVEILWGHQSGAARARAITRNACVVSHNTLLFVDAMVWQDDGRHWPYDQAVCGIGNSTVKTGNQSVRWCSMAALHVANERLQRVRHCWKRKFSGSTAPDAWRTLVAGGSGTAACATACAGEIDEYECVRGCLQRNQSAVVAATQQAFERVYSGREWVRQSEPSDPLSGHGSSLNRTLEARLALMRTIHQVCIWCFLTPILLATSLLPATDDAH